MKRIDKKKLYMIIGVIVLIITVIGSAYAYYSAMAVDKTTVSGTVAGGANLDLKVEKISIGANGNLIPVDNDTTTLTKAVIGEGNSNKEDSKRCIDKNGLTACQIYKITLTNKSSVSVNIDGGVTLSGDDTPNIECAIMDDINTVSNNKSCKGNKTLAKDYNMKANESVIYYMMVYIKNINSAQTDTGLFTGTVFFNVSGNKIESDFSDKATINEIASNYITSLYTDAEKSTVENNNITYNYATEVNLMNDRLGGTTSSLDGGNIRYYGPSPNNYVYFNCSDYNNQSSDTCELWRIIGVFDGKVKIMRNESIGKYSWDSSASAVNSGYGVNEWSQADLMKLLNPDYESESIGGSLYYNSSSGTCYNGYSNSTTSCDFTTTGIKNDITRNMIASVSWNSGSHNSSDIYSNVMYEKERGTTTISSPSDGITRKTSWTGKIALPYPSDYGYATDLSKCSQTLVNYDNSTDSYACRSNDWMYPIIKTNSYNWLLTPYSGRVYYVFSVNSSGYVGYNRSVYYEYGVAPVLYLSSEQVIESGDGSQNSPYQLLTD